MPSSKGLAGINTLQLISWLGCVPVNLTCHSCHRIILIFIVFPVLKLGILSDVSPLSVQGLFNYHYYKF